MEKVKNIIREPAVIDGPKIDFAYTNPFNNKVCMFSDRSRGTTTKLLSPKPNNYEKDIIRYTEEETDRATTESASTKQVDETFDPSKLQGEIT